MIRLALALEKEPKISSNPLPVLTKMIPSELPAAVIGPSQDNAQRELTLSPDKKAESAESQPLTNHERLLLQSVTAPIANLGLLRRTYNAVYRAGIHTIGDLASLPSETLLQGVRNIGETSLAEIETRLKGYLVENPDIGMKQDERSRDFPIAPTLSTTPDKPDVPLPPFSPFEADTIPMSETDMTPIRVLDLSVRSYNTLMRAGIGTIGRLMVLSDEEIGKVNNVGPKAINEIRGKLDGYLAENPLPLQVQKPEEKRSESAVPPQLLEQVVGIPLDDIPIERLGLSQILNAGLKRQSISSIQQLVRQASDLTNDGQIGEPLKRYLAWLVEQDEAVWAEEVASQGISPLHQLALANITLEQLVRQLLFPFNERQQKVIWWRFGLDDAPLTLEQVGKELELTRERVRQIEQKVIRNLQRPKQELRPFFVFIHHYLKQTGGLATTTQIADGLAEIMEIGQINPKGVCSLLLSTREEFIEIKSLKAWGLSILPLTLIPEIHEQAIRILAAEYAPLPQNELLTRFKTTDWYQKYADDGNDDNDLFILACINLSEKIILQADSFYGLERWGRQLVDNLVFALRQLGKPSHYSEITEVVNASLPIEQRTTPRLVHSQLGRYTDLFVWVRLRGTYGLKEWGLEQSLSYVDAIAYILETVGHPLTLEQVLERLPEVRPYFDHSSVIITLSTHPRFRPVPGNTYGLAKWTNSTNEASFDDLFSTQLAHWQAEFDHSRKKGTFDSQSEVDIIRTIGLDFFKE